MLTPVRSALPALLLFGAAAGTAAALAPDDPPAATAQAAQLEDAFATVAERVSPAVVSLRVEAEAPAGAPSPLQRFFGGGAAPPAIRRGGGSGFLIRPEASPVLLPKLVEECYRPRSEAAVLLVE